jgi:hypothetical protein
MIQNLVVNGCSYMEVYANGNGHVDLAGQLEIPRAESLAIGGSANSRILRTTLKHSYQAAEPTLYIMGLTFVSRLELPIIGMGPIEERTSFEGRWCNPQNQEFADRYDHFWNRSESERFVKQKIMVEAYSLIDRTEDLMYRILATIDSLRARGHRALVYQQADDSYQHLLDYDRLASFRTTDSIIDGFNWAAIIYQHKQGVPYNKDEESENFIGPQGTPEHIRHRKAGKHQVLNEYLVKYINDRNLI